MLDQDVAGFISMLLKETEWQNDLRANQAFRIKLHHRAVPPRQFHPKLPLDRVELFG
jgi:hypothetical protein